jgi:hypothetical protein
MRLGQAIISVGIALLMTLLACRPSPDLPPEPWAEKPIEEWPDLVFTNDLHFPDTTYRGIGNSFLVDLGRDTLAASVKHIFLFLREQRGLESVFLGQEFVRWEMRSLRRPEVVQDVGRPMNEDPSEEIGDFNTLQVRDWLVFDTDAAGTGLYPLRLRPSFLRKGEAAFAVGRSQADRESVHPKLTPLRIYDALGRHVSTLVDGDLPPGRHQRTWNGTNNAGQRVATGVYFYRMTAPGFASTKKMVLLQ